MDMLGHEPLHSRVSGTCDVSDTRWDGLTHLAMLAWVTSSRGRDVGGDI